MILDTWNLGSLASYVGTSVITIILSFVFRHIRTHLQGRAIKKSKASANTEAPVVAEIAVPAEAPVKVESRVEFFRLLGVVFVILAVILAVLLLVVVSLLQTSLPALAMSIAAGVIAALVVMTALMLAIGVPAYEFTMTLKAELQVLKEQLEALAQKQQLEGKVNSVEAGLQNVFSEQQLLPLRKPDSRKAKSRRQQKASKHHDVDYLKQAKADVGD